MIELPAVVVPVTATQTLVDAGGVMRSPLNTRALRVDRPGSHYMAQLDFPPVTDPATARVVVSRLIRAQRLGLRTWWPTPDAQIVAGAPVVDGDGQAGTSLAVRGIQPGTAVREGWWLSVMDAGGQSYLHNISTGAVAGADGSVTLPLSEALRAPLVDGTTVRLVSPQIEGIVVGDAREWSLSVERFVGFTVTVEEAG